MINTVGTRILERSVTRHVPGGFPGTGVGDDFMIISKIEGVTGIDSKIEGVAGRDSGIGSTPNQDSGISAGVKKNAYYLVAAQGCSDGSDVLLHDKDNLKHDTANLAHDIANPAHDTANPAHDTTNPAHDTANPSHDTTNPAHDTTNLAYDTSGGLALVRALNNLATSGAKPESVVINIEADEDCPEDKLRYEMTQFTDICKKHGLRIAGGNTVYRITNNCDISSVPYIVPENNQETASGTELKVRGTTSLADSQYSVLVTVYGMAEEKQVQKLTNKSALKPGDKVIMAGSAGLYGARVLVEKNFEKLSERFAPTYLRGVLNPDRAIPKNSERFLDYEISNLTQAMIAGGAKYIHDVSFGGVYRTFYETSEWSGLGIKIVHEHVPVRQDTIEICEYMNINPYELLGTGAVICVCGAENLEQMEESLRGALYEYSVVGELTQVKARVVVSCRNDMKRSLGMYAEEPLLTSLG